MNFLKTTASQAAVALTSEALDRTTMNALVLRLAQDPSVEYAEIDERAYPQMTPTDPLFATDQSSMKPGELVTWVARTSVQRGTERPLV